jgi:hypothetical protein
MNGLNVFGMPQAVTLEEATATLEAKLNPALIKERQQGNTKLSYIGGHTVIRLLNKAFKYQWSFEIVSEEIVPSQPKVNKYKPNDPPEAQPPVAKVLGRLTVPGYGVKEQYGSKVLIGGATEQEAAFKSASTDALKKCATLFGIGLELYGDDEDVPAPASNQSYSGGGNKGYSAPPAQPSAPANKPAPATPPPAQTSWEAGDIAKLKELKTILGITENPQLDSYVREFLDNANATYMDVSPANVKAFNIFLTKKAETA